MNALMRTLGWFIALCGLWESADIVLPFIIGLDKVQPLVWGHIVAGIVLVIAGAWAGLTREIETAKTMDWIATIAGGWLILAPFGLDIPRTSPSLWNDVAVGVLVLILASASGLLLQRRG